MLRKGMISYLGSFTNHEVALSTLHMIKVYATTIIIPIM